MSELLAKLSEPFPPEAIDWRVGATNGDKSKGIALAYIQARPVMDRLDEVVGLGNWADVYTPIQGKDGVVGFLCTLSLKIGDNWISKMDGADTSDIEAIKGGISDAFKRAAVKWGIGRYLYDLPGIWAPIEARGKSFVLKENPKLPNWALPKKKISSKVETPDPMTAERANAALGIVDDDEPEPVKTSRFTDEQVAKASAVFSETAGKTYGELTVPELAIRATQLLKSLKDNGLTKTERNAIQAKIDAAKLLMELKRPVD